MKTYFRDQRKMKGNSTQASVIVNCTTFSSDYFLELATARGITAGVCMHVLLIVVFVRAFESFLQRLFVYLTAFTVWYLAVQIMRIKPYTGLSQFCAAMGFLDQWATVLHL